MLIKEPSLHKEGRILFVKLIFFKTAGILRREAENSLPDRSAKGFDNFIDRTLSDNRVKDQCIVLLLGNHIAVTAGNVEYIFSHKL